MRKTALLSALGATSLVLMASPAQAAPPTSVWEPVQESSTELLPPADDPEFTEFCGFTPENPVVHSYTADLELFEQVRGSEFPYLAARGTSTDVYTNPDTGGTFTVTNTFFDKDLRIVDNGDGTITVSFNTVFRQRVYGSDGELLFVDQGHVREAVIVDYNGTPGDPDDDEFVGVVDGAFRINGHLETEGRDFCADFLEFTG
ncbi:hypothetical protein JD79_04066 [Geodermatophilus normandii]|uniref:Uncharacterized protein n=1 Tax=Geodermatophilus normandii TaxID=1137989 RepID=A0A317QRT7_9ACTN|nr:hypothetical protein [Geodermatophilus normandii]PWW24875.1 hypothetical protein JD79_04066 [Geodermatophilus normandii]